MAGLVKWGIKLGAVGGAVYLAASERFFGSTQETADSYGRLKGGRTAVLRLRTVTTTSHNPFVQIGKGIPLVHQIAYNYNLQFLRERVRVKNWY